MHTMKKTRKSGEKKKQEKKGEKRKEQTQSCPNPLHPKGKHALDSGSLGALFAANFRVVPQTRGKLPRNFQRSANLRLKNAIERVFLGTDQTPEHGVSLSLSLSQDRFHKTRVFFRGKLVRSRIAGHTSPAALAGAFFRSKTRWTRSVVRDAADTSRESFEPYLTRGLSEGHVLRLAQTRESSSECQNGQNPTEFHAGQAHARGALRTRRRPVHRAASGKTNSPFLGGAYSFPPEIRYACAERGRLSLWRLSQKDTFPAAKRERPRAQKARASYAPQVGAPPRVSPSLGGGSKDTHPKIRSRRYAPGGHVAGGVRRLLRRRPVPALVRDALARRSVDGGATPLSPQCVETRTWAVSSFRTVSRDVFGTRSTSVLGEEPQ